MVRIYAQNFDAVLVLTISLLTMLHLSFCPVSEETIQIYTFHDQDSFFHRICFV